MFSFWLGGAICLVLTLFNKSGNDWNAAFGENIRDRGAAVLAIVIWPISLGYSIYQDYKDKK
jgi:hypothetical protein